MPDPSESNVISDVLYGAELVLVGAVLVAVLVGIAAILFGFLIAPRLGRPLAYGGAIGVLEALARGLMRVAHRARFIGFTPDALPKGGFVVIANHSSGLDALLVQFAMPRQVRFMMAQDQMHPWLAPLWRGANVLPVTYGPKDAGMLRQAARHVKDGGIVGLFPERGISKQARTIDPFADGVGALVALTKAPVVLCWIRAPRTLGAALLDPLVPRARAEVELIGVFDFAKEGVREPAEICRRLREALAARSGWKLA